MYKTPKRTSLVSSWSLYWVFLYFVFCFCAQPLQHLKVPAIGYRLVHIKSLQLQPLSRNHCSTGR